MGLASLLHTLHACVMTFVRSMARRVVRGCQGHRAKVTSADVEGQPQCRTSAHVCSEGGLHSPR